MLTVPEAIQFLRCICVQDQRAIDVFQALYVCFRSNYPTPLKSCFFMSTVKNENKYLLMLETKYLTSNRISSSTDIFWKNNREKNKDSVRSAGVESRTLQQSLIKIDHWKQLPPFSEYKFFLGFSFPISTDIF
ncbi:hypothetical protein ABEB36_001751 [Hypothenemus hampei]|uniref:Uncharacterized protein n=1 Tax=Hypothenemus hampei TaxID=57062 RepID=A0ABD1FFL6_HYPHA